MSAAVITRIKRLIGKLPHEELPIVQRAVNARYTALTELKKANAWEQVKKAKIGTAFLQRSEGAHTDRWSVLNLRSRRLLHRVATFNTDVRGKGPCTYEVGVVKLVALDLIALPEHPLRREAVIAAEKAKAGA